MKPVASTLFHKFLLPRKTSESPYPALLLLHGRGADEEDLLGLAEYFDDRLFIVSPRAPFAFSHGPGYTWYDMEELGKPDQEMFRTSYGKLTRFIEDIRTGYPIHPGKLFMCGFSMGSIMSLTFALANPRSIPGVMANSGYLPESVGLEYRWQELKGKPFFIAHGRFDPVIPCSFGQRVRDLLEAHGAAVTYREYDMGHQIGEESLNDMIQWLSDRL